MNAALYAGHYYGRVVVADAGAQAIIKLSIEVLNEGLRPHLTQGQARFRHWYERRLKQYDAGDGDKVLDPQGLQSEFPQYAEMRSDMERVNQALIRYRAKMYEFGDEGLNGRVTTHKSARRLPSPTSPIS
jgi:hypothetical protein